MRSGAYAYRDRRTRKRDFRRLWIIRINAAARREGMSYSRVHPRPQRGRGRGQPQDARRHRRARSRGVPPICRASPGGRRGLDATAPFEPPGRLAGAGRPFCFAAYEMITSPHNEKLKLIRKLQAAEAPRALRACSSPRARTWSTRPSGPGRRPSSCSWRAQDVEPELLDAVSALGSGTRVIGVYRQSWSAARGRPARLPGRRRRPGQRRRRSSGPPTRSRDGPVVLGPGCADPYSPKAVRASMGSVFARPPARAALAELEGSSSRSTASAGAVLGEVDLRTPLVLCLGGEREGLPADVIAGADATARIPLRPDAPDSLNVGDRGRRGACTRSRIGWPTVPDLQGKIYELSRGGGGGDRRGGRCRRAGGAARSLPGPQGRADRDPARDRRAPGRGARAGRAGGQRGAPGAGGTSSPSGSRRSRRPSSRRGWRRRRST